MEKLKKILVKGFDKYFTHSLPKRTAEYGRVGQINMVWHPISRDDADNFVRSPEMVTVETRGFISENEKLQFAIAWDIVSKQKPGMEFESREFPQGSIPIDRSNTTDSTLYKTTKPEFDFKSIFFGASSDQTFLQEILHEVVQLKSFDKIPHETTIYFSFTLDDDHHYLYTILIKVEKPIVKSMPEDQYKEEDKKLDQRKQKTKSAWVKALDEYFKYLAKKIQTKNIDKKLGIINFECDFVIDALAAAYDEKYTKQQAEEDWEVLKKLPIGDIKRNIPFSSDFIDHKKSLKFRDSSLSFVKINDEAFFQEVINEAVKLKSFFLLPLEDSVYFVQSNTTRRYNLALRYEIDLSLLQKNEELKNPKSKLIKNDNSKVAKLIQQTEHDVPIYKHGMQIIDDEKTDWNGEFKNKYDAFDDNVGIADGVLGLTGFARSYGSCPLFIELYDTDPGTNDVDDYSGVIEASITISSGEVAIESPDASYVEVISIPVGIYQARVYYGNDNTGRYDCSDGADHARIVLFPSTMTEEVNIIKEKENVDDPITKYQGSRNEKELIAMLSSPIISYRCIAIVALLQLGKLDAVKPHIKNASKAMRYIYASAVWFVGKKAIPVLKELAESGDKEIKTRVIQSLEFIAMDEAAPILVELTKDSNHEISELAKYVLLNQYSKE